MKKLYFFLALLPSLGIGQSTTENFIKTTTYKIPTSTSISSPIAADAIIGVTYYDGLGRPIQMVANKQSASGNDIITHIEYDEFGRQSKDYLPFVNENSSMNYEPNALSKTLSYQDNSTGGLLPTNYNNQNPYSEKKYEESPVSRVIQQAAPGNIWILGGGHEIKFEYDTNTSQDAVILFNVVKLYNTTESYKYDLEYKGNYPPKQLLKKIIKNENWIIGKDNTTEEFKDSLDRIVLKRTYNNGDELSTYYVYDEVGNLIYVIPPKAMDTLITVNSSQVPYTFTQNYDISSFLINSSGNPVTGGGGMTININNSIINLSFNGGWNGSAYFDLSNSYEINAINPIPDMILGLIDINYGGNHQYRTVIQNNRLRFEDLTPNDPPFQFTSFNGQSLSQSLNNSLFGTTTVYNNSINDAPIDGLCYLYRYDSHNRLVEKKLPGKQWEYIVYDKLDRVVATGPALNPFGGPETGWLITKYETFGRVAYTGWLSQNSFDSNECKLLQDLYNAATTMCERAYHTTVDTVIMNYTNVTYPTTNLILLTINYYDDYTFPNAPTPPTTVYGATVATNVKGMPTASWIRTLTTLAEHLATTSYTFYDNKKFQPIAVTSNNYLGGFTTVKTKYNFTGQVLETNTRHKMSNTTELVLVHEEFIYTPQGRLLNHFHTINNNPTELIAHNQYDELGKLISKNVGGSDVTTCLGLQQVDYAYNIRGWLKNINDVSNLNKPNQPTDLFAFKINYDQVDNDVNGQVNPLYNGNISETFWRTASDNIQRKYGYQYDALNRLTNSYYQKPNMPNEYTNNYNESMSYDKNGNIQSLQRNGASDEQLMPLQIDDLTYTYPDNSNQLSSVTDATVDPNGFKDDTISATTDYTYDNNGNMTYDENKGITQIVYNHLNLPTKITFGNNGVINYFYSATGQKLKKVVTITSTETPTYYLDGFQYKNDDLQFFATAEGYVNISHTKYEGGVFLQETEKLDNKYSYVYNYTDHLGNIRLSYAKDPLSNGLRIIEENHYYPFGLKHTNYNSDKAIYCKENEVLKIKPLPPLFTVSFNYKYNGKEYQDELGLNMYNYGARNYEPALGRWMNIDPLAEKYRRWSPYTYCMDDPMRFVDPDGMKVVDKNGNEVGVTINTDKNGNKSASYTFAEGTKKRVIRDFNRNGGKVINSMVNSEKGLEMVNGVVNSKDNVSISISQESKGDRLGDTKVTNINMGMVDGKMTEINKDVSVVIYQGTINDARDIFSVLGNKETQAKVDSWNKNELTNSEIIGTSGGHEFYHVLNDLNIIGALTPEQHAKAKEVENQMIDEFGQKK